MIGTYEEIFQILNSLDQKPIYIAGHERPDYDSIGTGLALTRFLKLLNKEAYYLINEHDLKLLDWFNDLSFTTPVVNHQDYIFIQLDASRKNRLGEFEQYFDQASYTINIDHHENHLLEADYNFCVKGISSTAEVVYNIIRLFGKPLDKDIATLLYAGIITDTYGYSQRTDKHTYWVVSELINYGIDHQKVMKQVLLDKRPDELLILTDMINKIKYNEYGFHYIIMDRKESLYEKAEHNTMFKRCITTIQNITGINIIVMMLIENNQIYGNIRSNTNQEIGPLIGTLSGGGHRYSGGFINQKTIKENLAIIEKYLENF